MKPSQEDLEKWIIGCKSNDRTCQRKIYETLYSPMMAVCMRYAEDRQDATDILQDGFIKVFEKIGLYEDNGSFEGWVRRIIVNTAIDSIRKRKKELLTDDTGKYSKDWEDVDNDESIYSTLKISDVVEAMQELSPMYRMVFNLYVMDGLSHQEISEELDINIGTSKSNLSKARVKIKEILLKKLNK